MKYWLCKLTHHGLGLFIKDIGLQPGADWMLHEGKYMLLKPHKVHRHQCSCCGCYWEEDHDVEFLDEEGFNSFYSLNEDRRTQ